VPAGYSRTPLAKKLGVKPGHRVALIDAPKGFEDELAGLPDDAKVARGLRGTAPSDVSVVFATSESKLKASLAKAKARMTQDGAVWLCWPKKSSGVETDLSDGTVRKLGLAARLVDNKTCAVTEIWSGLRFVIRVKDRR